MVIDVQSTNKKSDTHDNDSPQPRPGDSHSDASNFDSDYATGQLQEMSLDDVTSVNQTEVTGANQPSDSNIESMSECCVEDVAEEPESEILKDLLLSKNGEVENTVQLETSDRLIVQYFIS